MSKNLVKHVHTAACRVEDWGPYGRVITCAQEYDSPSMIRHHNHKGA